MRPALFALLVIASSLSAQQLRQVTTADYARAEQFLARSTDSLVSGLAGRPTWIPNGGGRFWYRATTQAGSAFFVVDPVRRSRAPLFDHARLASALASASGMAVDADRLPFRTLEPSANGRTIAVVVRGRAWRCELEPYRCSNDSTPDVARAPEHASISPDGRTAVFIRDFNLWSKDLATGRETPLTTDGEKDFGYATNNAGWIHDDSPVVTWSADSRQIATFQHDGRGVSDMYLVTTNVGVPRLEAWKYPLPGDSVIFRVSRVIISRGGDGRPNVVRLQMPPDAHRSTVTDHFACGPRICDAAWYADGSHLAFISSSRDHRRAWFRVADARTGTVRTLLEERSATQIGDATLSDRLWRVLPGSNELIWWSQRDGWLQLYLYDLTSGELKNRITTGPGNVSDVLRVDEATRTIYFAANGKEPGRDPYFRHLYRVGFDGSGQALLTPEDAHHTISIAPDGKHLVDSYSTPETPPRTVLRSPDGRVLMNLERANVSRLVATGWKPPAPVRMKARDGTTDIYGLMFTPSNLDSTRKYPVVDYIYPGPQAGSVGPRSFLAAREDHQALAELGVIVVTIDGMGTPGRSKAFHDAYYGRMNDNTIPDQVAGIRELAARYPFMDVEKVGIWGLSGGGFAAAAAMFRYPDFFKVGIAESGNHDNRNYEDDWGERYQGLLVRSDSGDNYAAEANPSYASQLKGRLFLIHGAMDDNVPPYNTLLVVDALIKAGKSFDMLILPHERHIYGAASDYVMRRRWDYFVEHLMRAKPPR